MSTTHAALLRGLYLAARAARASSARLRSAPVPSPTVQLLKALWPSWRFFEDIGEVAVLRVRFGERASELGPWLPGLPRLSRRWSALVLSAEGNHLHACESLLQLLWSQMEEEAAEAEGGALDVATLEDMVSYRLTHQMARHALQAGHLAREAGALASLHYQFELCAADPDGGEEVLFVSPVHEA